MEFIDTHAHIYLKDFAEDRHLILERAAAIGISKIYMPNIDHTSIEDMLKVEEGAKDTCIAMMGLHPCSVKKDFEKDLYEVEHWLNKRKFAAVGEIGTDLYWDKTFWTQQQEAFKIQVDWAKQFKLPIVIHCRESLDQTIQMVEKLKDENLKGVFHCFSGNLEQAKKIAALGFYLGIGGVATFKNGGLDSVLPEVDLKHIVLETDSPYLAPVPHRGKRNEPAFIELVADRIAEIKKISVDEVAAISTKNANSLFNG